MTIFQRITIGSALILIAAVVISSLAAAYFVGQNADWYYLVVVFLLVISIGIGLDLFIVSAALRPLRDLGRLVKRLQSQSKDLQVSPLEDLKNADPYTLRMAATLHSLFVHLEERNQELHALSERAINAQEFERKVIAQSLHDDTGQALTMLAIHLDRINERIPDDEAALKKLVEEARELVASALDELRRILAGLRPAILDDLGLVPAIRWYARTNLEASGIHVVLNLPASSVQLPSPISTTLFRITQEAINNIIRHAHAKTATIALSIVNDEIYLRVEDDGSGFNQGQVTLDAVQYNHLGLLGIRERAQLVGGEVTIQSMPGKGCGLFVKIPVNGVGGIDHG